MPEKMKEYNFKCRKPRWLGLACTAGGKIRQSKPLRKKFVGFYQVKQVPQDLEFYVWLVYPTGQKCVHTKALNNF